MQTPLTARLSGGRPHPPYPLDTPRPGYDLADYLGMLRRGWWLLLATTLFGLVAALGVTAVQTKVYEASTAVLVLPTGVPNPELAGGRTKNTVNLDTEAQLVRSSATANLAKKLLKSSRSAVELRRAVAVSVPPNTAILEITYAAGDPETARAGSQAFAEAYLTNRQEGTKAELDAQIDALQAQVKGVEKQLRGVITKLDAQLDTDTGGDGYLTAQQQNLSSQLNALTSRLNELRTTPVSGGRVISDAQAPSDPSQPVLLLNLAAGLMVGMVLGVAAVLVRAYLDRRVHRGADVVRRAGVPLLTELTDRQAARSSSTGDAVFGAFTPAGRMFSRLRNEVAASLPPGSAVVVTGACRGPAAPTLAANLAVAFTRAGNSVALVYADVPGAWETGPGAPVTRLFGVPTTPGLSEVLAGRVELDEALVPAARHPELRVLPTGSTASAAGLLQSEAARRVLSSLTTRVEYVVVHAPSAAESADAQSLAIHADGVLLAVDLRRTTDVEVADAAEQLHRVGTPLLGAVVLPPLPVAKPTRASAPISGAPLGDTTVDAAATRDDTATLVLPRITDYQDDFGSDAGWDEAGPDHAGSSEDDAGSSGDPDESEPADDDGTDGVAGAAADTYRQNGKPQPRTSDGGRVPVSAGTVRAGRNQTRKPKGRRR